jgi:transposase-like protein
VWLYFRFTLSFRDVEDLLAERGIEVSFETIRQWAMRFGPEIARDLRSRRPCDEMARSKAQLLQKLVHQTVLARAPEVT